jgi:hypothetical protein
MNQSCLMVSRPTLFSIWRCLSCQCVWIDVWAVHWLRKSHLYDFEPMARPGWILYSSHWLQFICMNQNSFSTSTQIVKFSDHNFPPSSSPVPYTSADHFVSLDVVCSKMTFHIFFLILKLQKSIKLHCVCFAVPCSDLCEWIVFGFNVSSFNCIWIMIILI